MGKGNFCFTTSCFYFNFSSILREKIILLSNTFSSLRNVNFYLDVHAEKRSVKFTGSSVLIWITWLFSQFYQKLSSINRFSVRFTQRPVKSTEYEKIRVKLIVLYAKWNVLKSYVVQISTELPVNFTGLFSACGWSMALISVYLILIFRNCQ